MNNGRIKEINGNSSFQLNDNQILTFDVRSLHIHCLDGSVWVTWPDGHEQVLEKTQSAAIHSRGVICVQALSTGARVSGQNISDGA